MIPTSGVRDRGQWVVRLNRGRRNVKVTADYSVVENGCLKFRNSVRNSYPVTVMAFAQGEWVSVENRSITCDG